MDQGSPGAEVVLASEAPLPAERAFVVRLRAWQRPSLNPVASPEHETVEHLVPASPRATQTNGEREMPRKTGTLLPRATTLAALTACVLVGLPSAKARASTIVVNDTTSCAAIGGTVTVGPACRL